ncbi:MAG: septum formation initiator family protein [Candidatus Omnitrophica bacterium]|nr:septum formation initiator family protein [Candidatus Omnitrophota bacterium]
MFRKAFVLFGITFLLLIFFLPGYAKLQDLRQKNKELAEKIIELKNENKKLALERKRIEEDPVYLEKLAREKLGIVRKGEIVYKIEE